MRPVVRDAVAALAHYFRSGCEVTGERTKRARKCASRRCRCQEIFGHRPAIVSFPQQPSPPMAFTVKAHHELYFAVFSRTNKFNHINESSMAARPLALDEARTAGQRDALMPRDPYIRKKFTRNIVAARQHAAKTHQRPFLIHLEAPSGVTLPGHQT
jgi:hypothetical protein